MGRTRARFLAVALVVFCSVTAAVLATRPAESSPPPGSASPSAAAINFSIAEPSGKDKDALDRQTPRRSMEGFLKEGREGDFTVAASYLDLSGLPEAQRGSQGPLLAQK